MDKEIIEGNRLIAEFLGKDYAETDSEKGYLYPVNGAFDRRLMPVQMQYHSSWDWLMPVGKKIRTTLEQMHEKMPKHSACQGDVIEVDIHCAHHEYDIEKAFRFIVQFIQWYNTQQQ